MKKIVAAVAFGLVLSACGGGGGGGPSYRDPDSVQFTFGGSQTVTSGSEESDVAGNGAATANALLALTEATDPAAAKELAMEVALSAQSLGEFEKPGTALLRKALAPTPDFTDFDPSCITVTLGESVRYDGCRATTTEEGMTVQVRLDGSFTFAPGHAQWDLTASMNMSASFDGQSMSGRASEHLTGDIVVSEADRTVQGFSRADLSISASSGGRSESMAVTYNADYDLTYATDWSSITAGTLTLKRLWAEVPSETDDDPAYQDAAVRFTWADGSIQVAWSE